MTDLFLKIVNMSIAASWLVAVVLLLRFILKKSPKWISVLLWGLVALRLICPVFVQTSFSLIPSTTTISQNIISGPSFRVDSGIAQVDEQINEYLADHYFEGVTVPADNGWNVMSFLTIAWIIGAALMLLYAIVSYISLRFRVRTAVRLQDRIFFGEEVPAPFVLGFFFPRIYIPLDKSDCEMTYVIAHEQAHIVRKDHWWKPMGFILLSLHWFNPIMWLAYILLCRDIEMACDEKVVRSLSECERANYSQALLNCSTDRKRITACPLAFGEVGIKTRVKSVLTYRRPAFWMILSALVLCLAIAVCFLTDPFSPAAAFRHWTATVSQKNIESAYLWTGSTGKVPLTDDETQRFLQILNGLKVGDFEENIALSGITPEYGIAIKTTDGNQMSWNESGKRGTVETSFQGKTWWIHSDALESFLDQLAYSATYEEPTKRLSLHAVIGLSRKGMALVVEDLKDYQCEEIGSGLYIFRYDIDQDYCLLLGCDSPKGQPLYADLCAINTGGKMDIRSGDVGAFILEENELSDKLSVRAGTAIMRQAVTGARAVYTWTYDSNNTVVCEEQSGRILHLDYVGQARFGGYRIYLEDGSLYDDGVRLAHESSVSYVIYGERLSLVMPQDAGTYYYELTLDRPEYNRTMVYGLKVEVIGDEMEQLEPTINGDPKYPAIPAVSELGTLTVSQINALFNGKDISVVCWAWGEPNHVRRESDYVYALPDPYAVLIFHVDEQGVIESCEICYSNSMLTFD